MSYRNPARLVDTQSGQHFRNMQKSLSDSTTGFIKADTAFKVQEANAAKEKIQKLIVKREKEQIVLEDAAVQSNQKYNTSTNWDSLRPQLARKWQIEQKQPHERTAEDNKFIGNMRNIKGFIDQTNSNIVSYLDGEYDKILNAGVGKEGGADGTSASNILKIKALEVFQKGGDIRGVMDPITGLVTVSAYEDGKLVGSVTGNETDYSVKTVPSIKDQLAEIDGTLRKSIQMAGESHDIYKGNDPEPYVDPNTNKTTYFKKATKDTIKRQIKDQVTAMVSGMGNDAVTLYNNKYANGELISEFTTAEFADEDNAEAQEALKTISEAVQNDFTERNGKDLLNKSKYDVETPAKDTNKPLTSTQIKEMEQLDTFKDAYSRLKNKDSQKVFKALSDHKKHPIESKAALEELLAGFDGLKITELKAPNFEYSEEKPEPDMKNVTHISVGKSPSTSVTLDLSNDSSDQMIEKITKAFIKSNPTTNAIMQRVTGKSDNNSNASRFNK